MATITGFDEFQKQLDEAIVAFKALDGEIATLNLNPDDPASIEAACRHMEDAIDARVAPYRGNSMVEDVTTQFKDAQRRAIVDRAAQARLSGVKPMTGRS